MKVPGVAFVRDLPRRIGYGKGPRVMSWLRKRWILLRHPHADIRFLGPVHIGPGFSLHMPDGGSFVVGPRVQFRHGFRAEIARDGRVEIGADTIFTYSVLIHCSTSIDIGERCAIGLTVLIVDGNHEYRDHTRTMMEQGYNFRPIAIADDVNIAGKATIMASVGQHSFVAANAVVTKDAPPWCVIGGVPGRVIDYFGPEGSAPDGWDGPSSSLAT